MVAFGFFIQDNFYGISVSTKNLAFQVIDNPTQIGSQEQKGEECAGSCRRYEGCSQAWLD